MIDTRSVEARLAGTTHDLTEAHQQITTGMRQLAEAFYGAFEVRQHPTSRPFAAFSSADEAMRGSVRASSGGPIDWAIDSFIASPRQGFCNHHLTIWLGPQVGVPHLAFAIGTIPQLFAFCDLVPRSDPFTDAAHLDQYHSHFNDRAMAIAADARFSPFLSRELYIRGAISPVGICHTAEPTPHTIDLVLGMYREALAVWTKWVKEATPTSMEQRADLEARDRTIRETVCIRDPANVVAQKVLGPSMTDQLVRLLAGTVRS